MKITPNIILQHLVSPVIQVYVTVVMNCWFWCGVGRNIHTQVFQLVTTVLYRGWASRVGDGVRVVREKNFEHIHYNNTTNTRIVDKHAANSHIPPRLTPLPLLFHHHHHFI